LEKTPEVENKYKEVSLEDKKAEIEKIKSSMTEEEVKDTFTIKEEKKDVPVTPVKEPEKEVKDTPEQVSQIEKVAQTLMTQGIERVHQHYKDFDVSGIVKDPSVDTLTKVQLLSTVAEPNAIKMANLEKNLKNDDAEGTKTETKKAEFTAPEKSGKVDNEAGTKLYTQMCDQLGLEEEQTKKEKSE